MKFSDVSTSTTKGTEPRRGHKKRPSFRSVQIPTETHGASSRDRALIGIRDEFMSAKGIGGETFLNEFGDGRNYREWRAFAASRGLHLPA